MEIKIELKGISDKTIDLLEEEMKQSIQLLNEEQKTNLKHGVMDLKISIDNIERKIKNIILELKELRQPKKQEQEKQVEKKESEEVEEIDL